MNVFKSEYVLNYGYGTSSLNVYKKIKAKTLFLAYKLKMSLLCLYTEKLI